MVEAKVREELRHAELMEKMDQILQAVLQGQKDAALLLPMLNAQTGQADISEIQEELISCGVPEEEVQENAESIREYVEQHRDEVSTATGRTHQVSVYENS